MAAHGIADYLRRDIVEISYADLASKCFGQGAKNVRSLFDGLAGSSVTLFIDGAEFLLSSRVEDTFQPAASANNAMRTEMLACLERFAGVVIFATNLLVMYDKAIDTRVKQVEFSLPVGAYAEMIWAVHLPESLPLEIDVNPPKLAKLFPGICGRDMKNIVVDAAVLSVLDGRPAFALSDLEDAHKKVMARREAKSVKRLTDEDVIAMEEQLLT